MMRLPPRRRARPTGRPCGARKACIARSARRTLDDSARSRHTRSPVLPIASMIPLASGLSAFAEDADLLFVDVWGVLHDGVAPYASAVDALQKHRGRGGFVMLVSNAPRPAIHVVRFLDGIGVPRNAYDGVATSGDVARALLARGAFDPLAYIGPEKDRTLFEGLRIRDVSVEDAAVVLCAGLVDDERETPDDYRALLEACAGRNLPMICANPDIWVDRGPRRVWCAGALAERYEAMGRTVIWTGKPHRAIYDAALDIAQLTRGRAIDPARMLAIGDAVRTDIAGAHHFGVRSLLIADGIHAQELCDGERRIDGAKAESFLAAATHRPDAMMARLAW